MKPIIYPEMWRKVTKDNIIQKFKVDDQMYIFDEVNSARMYLLVGKTGAFLYDTGFGFQEFRSQIEEITDLPLTVVCSHGHDDHIYGAFQFEEAYIHEADYNLLMSNDNPKQLEKQILARKYKTPEIEELVDREEYLKLDIKKCKWKFVKEGDKFDLGGLTIEIFALPGHTKGSIAAYCPERKALFCGDAMSKNHKLVYGQALEVSATPQEFIRALTVLSKLDVESVWPGHGDTPAPASLVTDTREMLIRFAHEADLEKDGEEHNGPAIFGPQGKRMVYHFHHKDLFMSYHPGHLDQIREYMKEHDGAVE